MKTSIKLLALVLAAGFPCAAFAEMLGARIPAALNVENMVGVFSAVLIALLLTADYSRRTRILAVHAPARSTSTETHRLAA